MSIAFCFYHNCTWPDELCRKWLCQDYKRDQKKNQNGMKTAKIGTFELSYTWNDFFMV